METTLRGTTAVRLLALVAAVSLGGACRRSPAAAPPPSPAEASSALRTVTDEVLRWLEAEQDRSRSDRQSTPSASERTRVQGWHTRLTRLSPALHSADERTGARMLSAVLEIELARIEQARTAAAGRAATAQRQYALVLRRACLSQVDPDATYEAALAELGRIRSAARELAHGHAPGAEWQKYAAQLAGARIEPLIEIAKRANDRLQQPVSALRLNPAAPLHWRVATGDRMEDSTPLWTQVSGGATDPPPASASAPAATTVLVSERATVHARLAIDAATAAVLAPGRLLSAQAAQRAPRTARWQAVLAVPLFEEGWALYAARLGQELGAYPDPAAQAGLLAFEAVAAVRAAVDIGLHGHGWTEEQARALFSGHTLLDRAEIEAELKAIQAAPARAVAAFVGARAFDRVAASAKQALGQGYRPGPLFAAVLAGGAVDETGIVEAAERYRSRVQTSSDGENSRP